MQKPLTMIDLFAGCGGIGGASFVANGFKPVQTVEWAVHAAATYAANFSEGHTHGGDIGAALRKDIP